MLYRFDPLALRRRLGGLQGWARLAFGALLLDRALPNFLQFQADTGAAGGAMLRGAQAKVWGLLEGNNAGGPFLGISASTCEFFAPNTEQSKSLYTSSALDAVTIACNVLDYVDTDRIDLLVESANLRRDSIDVFLQVAQGLDASGVDLERRLLTHPLMQEELRFQESDLIFLAELQSKDRHGWAVVLRRSIDLGYSMLGMTSTQK